MTKTVRATDAVGKPSLTLLGNYPEETMLYLQVVTGAGATLYFSRNEDELVRFEGQRITSADGIQPIRWKGKLFGRGSAVTVIDIQVM